MLNLTVLVSGGGTNLQAIMDAIDHGAIRGARIAAVISNNRQAFALERAQKHGIEAVCISPKDYENRALFHEALLEKIRSVKTVANARMQGVLLNGEEIIISRSYIRELKRKLGL